MNLDFGMRREWMREGSDLRSTLPEIDFFGGVEFYLLFYLNKDLSSLLSFPYFLSLIMELLSYPISYIDIPFI